MSHVPSGQQNLGARGRHDSGVGQHPGVNALIEIAHATASTEVSPAITLSPEKGQAAPAPTLMPIGVGFDTTRDRPEGFFITPDTAPKGLSIQRPRWVAPALLILFAACTAGIHQWIQPMTQVYGNWLCALVNVPYGTFGNQRTVAVRPLFLLLALLFALLVSGPWLRRVRLFITTAFTFSLLVLVTDLVLTRLSLLGTLNPFGALGNMIAGLDGIPALAVGIFTTAALPPGIIVRAEQQRPRRDILLLFITIMLSVVIVWTTKHYWDSKLTFLSRVPLLGGIGSVLVIFFCVLPILLYLLDLVRRRTRRISSNDFLSVDFGVRV